MQIAISSSTRDTANPFLADVANRMRKGLRASSADDALAQLLGDAYDHPATQLKQTPPSQPIPLIVPIPEIPQAKEPDAHRHAPVNRAIDMFAQRAVSVYASQVRGSMLDQLV
jgi:hypothetical protein